MALTACYKGQNTYKEPLEIKDRIIFWRFVLEKTHPMSHVLYAIKQFVLRNTNMPVPADINNILDPVRPEITQTEFIYAQKQWALENYSPFSKHCDIVKAYEQQTAKKHEGKKFENEEINKIVQQSIKRIT
jgi:hypothetical protein